MEEEYKEIKGYEGLYSISNKGRIICWNYKGLGYPKDITPHCNGYQRVGLVKDGIRKLTPKETFKLQGFPVDNGYELPTKINGRNYPDSQLYKQAGNAVSVPVIELLAAEILKILD